MINLPVEISQKIEGLTQLDRITQYTTNFLDKNPTVTKIAVFSAHLFRMMTMAYAIGNMPFSLPINFSIALAENFLYRISIERCCEFKFALPSTFGAAAYLLAAPAVTALFQGAVLTGTLGLLPLAAYTFAIISFSNHDVACRT